MVEIALLQHSNCRGSDTHIHGRGKLSKWRAHEISTGLYHYRYSVRVSDLVSSVETGLANILGTDGPLNIAINGH